MNEQHLSIVRTFFVSALLLLALIIPSQGFPENGEEPQRIAPEEFINGRPLTHRLFAGMLCYVYGVSPYSQDYLKLQQLANGIEIDGITWQVDFEEIYFPQFDEARRMLIWQRNANNARNVKQIPGLPPAHDPNMELLIVASRLGAAKMATAYLLMAAYKVLEAREVSDEAVTFAEDYVAASLRRHLAAQELQQQEVVDLLARAGVETDRIEEIVAGGSISALEIERLASIRERLQSQSSASADQQVLLNICNTLLSLTEEAESYRRKCREKLDEKEGWALESSSDLIAAMTAVTQPVLDAILAQPDDLLRQATLDETARKIYEQRAYLHRLAIAETENMKNALQYVELAFKGILNGTFAVQHSTEEGEEPDTTIITANKLSRVLDTPAELEAFRNALLALPYDEMIEVLSRSQPREALQRLAEDLRSRGQLAADERLQLSTIDSKESLDLFVKSYMEISDLQRLIGELRAEDVRLLLYRNQGEIGEADKVRLHHYGVRHAKKLLAYFR